MPLKKTKLFQPNTLFLPALIRILTAHNPMTCLTPENLKCNQKSAFKCTFKEVSLVLDILSTCTRPGSFLRYARNSERVVLTSNDVLIQTNFTAHGSLSVLIHERVLQQRQMTLMVTWKVPEQIVRSDVFQERIS